MMRRLVNHVKLRRKYPDGYSYLYLGAGLYFASGRWGGRNPENESWKHVFWKLYRDRAA